MRLLTIDNGCDLPKGYTDGFRRAGFKGERVSNFSKGEWMLQKNNYDLVIISGGSPTEVLNFINGVLSKIFQGFLLVLAEENILEERIALYRSGVDEVLMMPLSFREILAKVRVLAGREKKKNFYKNYFRLDDLLMDLTKYKVWRGGKEINLRKKEFDLLFHLVSNEGSVLDKISILEAVWDSNIETVTNTLEVHILGLRRKVDRGCPPARRLIHTIYGRGYCFGLQRDDYSPSPLATGSFGSIETNFDSPSGQDCRLSFSGT